MSYEGRLDAEDVRAALRVTAVLDRFGVVHPDRPEIRLATCPACGKTQRRAAFLVDRESGDWIHHSGADVGGAACKGDIFGLVAALAGLDVRREFSRVLEFGAEIAGLSPDTDSAELARRRAAYQAQREVVRRQAAEERAAAEERVPTLWNALTRRHATGEQYLTGRGIDPAELRACGDVVRYRQNGSPAVLLHDFDGRSINIVTRMLAGDSKILSLDIRRTLGKLDAIGTHSTTGSLVGRIAALDTCGEGADVAILVEGVADTLAAVLAFPGCVVLGANGWYQMPRVAAAVEPRLVEARGWLLVGVDDDEQGITGAGDAMHAAVEAGLVLRKSVRAIELGPHKDLADAWRAGWRRGRMTAAPRAAQRDRR